MIKAVATPTITRFAQTTKDGFCLQDCTSQELPALLSMVLRQGAGCQSAPALEAPGVPGVSRTLLKNRVLLSYSLFNCRPWSGHSIILDFCFFCKTGGINYMSSQHKSEDSGRKLLPFLLLFFLLHSLKRQTAKAYCCLYLIYMRQEAHLYISSQIDQRTKYGFKSQM